MVSEDEYEALMETVHLLRSPANTTRLLQSIQEANKSELTEGMVATEEGCSRVHGDHTD
jgi:PHD/YefM family antitoxin component YafN of YafNO toxin-antitoxin module